MIPVYQGVPRQQGYGLGSVFKSAMKTATPFLKPVVKSSLESLKNQTLKQGVAAARDIFIKGKRPRQVIKTRGKQALKNLGLDVLKSLQHINKKKSVKPRQSSNRRGRVNISKRKFGVERSNVHSRSLDIFD